MEVVNIFASIVSEEEWSEVPKNVADKIERFVRDKFEDLITTKAMLETKRCQTEQCMSDMKLQHDQIVSENETLKARLAMTTQTLHEMEAQISHVTADLAKLQAQCNKLELEAADFRHQRNLAVDEKDEYQRMLQRRNTEVERMQTDLSTLTNQLEAAINAKCEALAKADEVASMKITLDYKEKRMEQERALMNSQNASLTEDLNRRTEELLNMRRDNSSRCIQLENKLTAKLQELAVVQEQVKSLTELNNNLSQRNDELSKSVMSQREIDAKMNESYLNEIEAKTKMSNAYKAMHEESQQHANELEGALSQVQGLLKTATDKYGELETKHKEVLLSNEEIICKKNEYIAMLKKELNMANDFLENLKQDPVLDSLSPSVGGARSAQTITEIYSQYVAVSEKLTNKEEECERLNNYIKSIVSEIQEKGPLIKKLRMDYSDSLDANDALKSSNDALLNELQQIRESNAEDKKLQSVTMRENERLKKQVTDLSRQVCHLVQEVEHARIGSSSNSTEVDINDSICSADIISKKLVTFNDISELQATNQRLLALVRDLSERQEEAEALDPAAVSNLKLKLDDLRETQNEMLEERDRQNKMMVTLRNQRDMYKKLYNQSAKAAGVDIQMQLDRSYNPDEETGGKTLDKDSNLDQKVQEYVNQLETLKKTIANLKEEHDNYRKEKSDNDKMVQEELDRTRAEVKELTKLNCKLQSQNEMNEEKFKVLQNNLDVYRKQITALEKKNKIFSESIVKHEQAATYLKDEALQCQTKLSKAEVMLANIQKENALLRDAEQRLLKERQIFDRDSMQQHLIKSNMELIKATLERADAEGRIRIESRLDEAHRECSALRRRLQEEQDGFRQLSDHLNKQTQNAQSRMEEEKSLADKLRAEVTDLREELVNKSTQVEELTKKLKLSVLAIPESNVDGRKIRELENQLSDAQAEINALKAKLTTAKEASEQYCNVAETSEKQVVELMQQQQLLQQENASLKAQLTELQEKCNELQGELSIQMDDQDIANASVQSKSSLLQQELNTTSMDLATAKEQLEATRSELRAISEQLKAVENKYAREVMLHSVDLQALTSMKEEMDKALSQLNQLKSERDQAQEALSESQQSWLEQEKIINRDKLIIEQRFNDMEDQNSLLLDQIQALNTNMSILQAKSSADCSQNTSVGDASFNRSFTEDEVKSSEQLLKVIKYLRQEKDIAVGKAEIIEAEHMRLKSQFEQITKQFEEIKAAQELERQKSEVNVVSSAKHAELLRKLETHNAITDSNRTLRQERDELLSQIEGFRSRVEKLEAEIVPLQETNRDLTTKADQMQNENISLRSEATRWRQRANMLIEKTNRTSPEDWKKLQSERENLAKQLTIERANTTKLNDDVNNLRQDKTKLEDLVKNFSEEVPQLKENLTTLRSDLTQMTQSFEQLQEDNKQVVEENKQLKDFKEASLNELRSNLGQIRKIAKKYKTQSEDYLKEIETLKQERDAKQVEQSSAMETKDKQLQEQRTELEDKITQLESTHKETIEQLHQQVSSSTEQIDNFKKEIENLKLVSQEKEERFKNLFKNAKDRIMTLTEQNNSLKEELNKQSKSDSLESGAGSSSNVDYMNKIDALQREKDEILSERLQDKEKSLIEIEALTQRVNQLQRQLGLQQGSKPSTSSNTSEKSTSEPPTANIKPMAGHSTNTQTQSATIQPWRSGGEPPLASIRPMSAQLRTVAVLPTSQTPSAVMVPPQQQVHTTGSSSIEALSSSPTSSHTDYVPATSSATSAMLGPRQQVAVPPTQSSQDNEDDESNLQMQTTPQQQAVALVLPRVEPPSSGGPTQEQGTSSSSSNTVTTTQASLKRQRDADVDLCQTDEPNKTQLQQSKRIRVQQTGTVTDSGLEVEYQVPTSSQRDHDDDNVIVVESDEEGGPDEGEGADDDQDDPDTEGYDMEGMEQDNYEDGECEEVEDEGGNEVEVIEDSSEVPNQSQRSTQENVDEEGAQQAQSEAIGSGTAEGSSSAGVKFSQASTSTSMTISSFSRSRPVAPLSSRPPSSSQHPQSHLLLSSHHGLDECGDDGIVPSTPTLFVPRRSDGFGETVGSPHVPTSGRFTFNETMQATTHSGSSEVVPEQTLEVANIDDSGTGRSVPTTPLQSSPQESVAIPDEHCPHPNVSEAENVHLGSGDVADPLQIEDGPAASMGPPTTAGTSSEGNQSTESVQELMEGDDEVSSEGEKPVVTEEGSEEEGREAEASPSPVTRSRNARGPPTRRSIRQPTPRGNLSRAGPTPIIWNDPRGPPRQPSPVGRGGNPQNFSRAMARRSRGRLQRPFGRF